MKIIIITAFTLLNWKREIIEEDFKGKDLAVDWFICIKYLNHMLSWREKTCTF